jgi:hypothetical protein
LNVHETERVVDTGGLTHLRELGSPLHDLPMCGLLQRKHLGPVTAGEGPKGLCMWCRDADRRYRRELRTFGEYRPARHGGGESTAAYMQRTDPVAYQQCRDAGRLP